MKRIWFFILIIVCLFFCIDTNAKTLGDLKNELAQLEKQKAEQDNKKQLTESEMNKVNDRIDVITKTIESSENKIKDLSDEIVVLEEKAVEKETEIKDVVSFLQVTNSENAYMEYIFGAQSIEDLILRSAVSEQLVAYNDDLIAEYNNTVKEYRAKTEELKLEITNLDNEQDNLKDELTKLGDTLDEVVDVTADIKAEIDAQKKMIKYYQDTLGCTDDQDINSCGKVPYSGKMVRPVMSGRITSNFGYRLHPTKKVWKLHSGTDIAGGATDIYAVAPGTVAGIMWKTSCGGTMLFVHHNINGTYYTSAYYHLYKVLVKEGDYVDQNTKIAVMGGSKSLTPWDTCTTGRHLHLSIARGLYMKEYTSWSTYTAKLVNPVSVINFPAKGVWFSNRTTKY